MVDLNKFMEFKNSIKNQNPQMILNQLISSGRFTKEQVEEATKKAKELLSLFK